MKLFFTVIVCLLCINCYSQQLFIGTYREGGPSNAGGLFMIDENGENYNVLFPLPVDKPGGRPSAGLMLHSNGKVYGTTLRGGENNSGILFEFDQTNSGIIALASFGTNDESYDTPVELPDGKLLGANSECDANQFGYLYTYDITTGLYQIVFRFGNGNGAFPASSPIIASNGLLYGTTGSGGSEGLGTLYSYDLANNTVQVLHNFGSGTSADLRPSTGRLVQAGNGLLYGITGRDNSFGANNGGIVYSYDIANDIFTEQGQLDESVIGADAVGLTEASNGLMYSTTRSHPTTNGSVFSFNPSTNVLTKITDLTTTTSDIRKSFIVGSDGKLYNHAFGGAIFSFDPTSNQLDELKEINTDVSRGLGRIIETSPGQFFGVGRETSVGEGGLYSYNLPNDQLSIEAIFGETLIGNIPFRSTLKASDGFYYGTAREGGTADQGTIFKIDLSTGASELLHSFLGTDGRFPQGSLIQAADGLIYGTTNSGGVNNSGVLFSYDPVSNTFTKQFDFNAATSGNNPRPLTIGADGNLIGTTGDGGVLGHGVLFSFNIATNSYSKNVDFGLTGNDGRTSSPEAIIVAPNGKLYGTTQRGGTNNRGVIYEYDPILNDMNTLYSFASSEDGLEIASKLTIDNNIIYGNARSGGSNNAGTLFQYDLANSTFTKLHDFEFNNGSRPEGNLLLSNDRLIGVTNEGGLNFNGVVYSYDLASANYSVTENLNTNAGSGFYGGFASFCAQPFTSFNTSSFEICTNESIDILVNSDNTDTFVWKKDGQVLNEILSSSLTITSTRKSDTGTYEVELTNVCGTTQVQFDLSVIGPDLSASFDGSVVTLSASEGLPPYRYLSNGIDFQDDNVFSLPNGQYTFTVRDANGCEATTSEAIAVTSVSYRFNSLPFYPNPVKEVLNVRDLKESMIKVIDSKGIAVLQKEVIEVDEQFSLRFLKPGLYLLEIIHNEDQIRRYRLVKQ
ncbi:MAG: choice-of-anchor tandem repeat GloVer-containing protein [Bacteroidota bacterium]